MTFDLLREATRAARELADGTPPADADTRARVVAAVRERAHARRRLVLVRIVVPLAAVLVASSAWAASTGRLDSMAFVFGRFGTDPDPSALVAPTARAGLGGVVHAAPRARALADGTDAAPEPAPRAAAVNRVGPEVASAPGANATPHALRSALVEESDATQALYAAAHRAHFVDRSWSSALAAWDRYLAAAPRGRFAIDARYSRALCLVRLGRAAQARAALEPFARGASGPYRREEARALLDALDGKSSAPADAGPAVGADAP